MPQVSVKKEPQTKVKPLTLGEKSALKKAQKKAANDAFEKAQEAAVNEARMIVSLAPHMSLFEMRQGQCSYDGWGTVNYRVHLGAALSVYFSSEHLVDIFVDAASVMQDIYIRTCAQESEWVGTASECDALLLALNLTDEMHLHCVHGELKLAYHIATETVYDLECTLHQEHVLSRQ